MSLIELLVAGGLAAMVIGITVAPMIQMRELESKVEFQTSLDTAHQIALQRARNGTLIKKYLGISPGNPNDKCFGGRGTGCQNLTRTPAGSTNPVPIGGEVDKLTYSPTAGQSADSIITLTPSCPSADHCDSVRVSVRTVKSGQGQNSQGSSGRLDFGNQSGRVLTAAFTIPAAALASRQEINFACASATSAV